MIDGGDLLWRVGYHVDPAGFTPTDRCSWGHRFDDPSKAVRSLYVAEEPITALREVLADLRPSAEAIADFVGAFGPDALSEVVTRPVSASWRRQHVLLPVSLELNGAFIDLCDLRTRQAVERRYAALLTEHGMAHLDLGEITTKRRPVTQAIAGHLLRNHDAAAIRFPSCLDGSACVVVYESRCDVVEAGEAISLCDPAPEVLARVCAEWDIAMEPAG